jgi:hypothetical protein
LNTLILHRIRALSLRQKRFDATGEKLWNARNPIASQNCPEDGFAFRGMTPNEGSASSYLDTIENEEDNNRAIFSYAPDQYLFSGCPRGIDFDPRDLQGTRIPCILRCLLPNQLQTLVVRTRSDYIPIKLLRRMVSIAASRLHLGISHALSSV